MALNIADLVEHAVDLVPDRVALVDGCVDSRELTYAQLEERSNKLAHYLQRQGVKPGDKVGIYSRNTIEAVEAMIAIFKARAVMVNVNYRYVENELHYIFDNSDMVALIFERRYADKVSNVLAHTPLITTALVVEDGTTAVSSAIPYEQALAENSGVRDFGERSADDIYMLYTGGTTGNPKGVMWRHEDIYRVLGGGINFVTGEYVEDEWGLARMGAENPVMTRFPIPPMIHGGAQWATFQSLFGGGKCVMYPEFDGAEIWRIVDRHKVNLIFITGDAMARPMLDALETETYDLSSLYLMASSAALFSPSIKEKFLELLPNRMITDSIGSSETGFGGMSIVAKGMENTGGPRVKIDASTTVLDTDGKHIEPGSTKVGQLARRGHIPMGYYKDEAKSAATFKVIDGVRYSIPGDFAKVESDGSVTMLGRGSVSINSGGEKIYPEEVEGALKSHPDIFDALVVGVPDERFGQRVAAVIQARKEVQPTLVEINELLRQQLAGYKIPRMLWFVDQIKRSPAGKPDYRWAAEYVASCEPDENSDLMSARLTTETVIE
ncbi:MAG: acyl-CoA synthetase [Mycobacteriaceae bacterium]